MGCVWRQQPNPTKNEIYHDIETITTRYGICFRMLLKSLTECLNEVFSNFINILK